MKKLKPIKTKDGSFTLYNEELKEYYHSISGAKEEAFEKYIKPVMRLLKTDEFKILDFCFGLGYNTAAALEYLIDKTNAHSIHILGLEIDKDLLLSLNKIKTDFKYYDKICYAANKGEIKFNNAFLEIRIGDATQIIKKLQREYFNIVFFDPFSPNKDPNMWKKEIFKNIFKIMKENGILATYSSAPFVRENLKKVGFEVIDGPSIGRKSPSTLAIK